MATLLSVEQAKQNLPAPVEIEVPASTAWPFVLAVGFVLMFAGLLTSASVSVLGVVLAQPVSAPEFPGSGGSGSSFPAPERWRSSTAAGTGACSKTG